MFMLGIEYFRHGEFKKKKSFAKHVLSLFFRYMNLLQTSICASELNDLNPTQKHI